MTRPTDSSIVEYNEDGSQTITTVETYYPPTKAEKITTLVVLGGAVVASLGLPAILAFADYREERKARKAREKLAEEGTE